MHTSLLPSADINGELIQYMGRYEPMGSIDILIPAIHQTKWDFLKSDEISKNFLLRSLIGRYRNRVIRSLVGRWPIGKLPAKKREAVKLEITRREIERREYLKYWMRTQYQKKGQNLRRYSMRVEEDVWLELKLLSLATRCSMSMILVFMVCWEYKRRKKFWKRKWDPAPDGYVGTSTVHSVMYTYNEYTKKMHLTMNFSPARPLTLPPWYTWPG
ncbi:MAG: DUF1564 family protein [Leptonema sp. (in: Bacteria)]|nr:DUF1564 family protein [Leptonema sp. (in: bacteria)]